ncbi:MAG: DUF1801 domain-containing protein [Bacteroidia bacterium]|nr:DUF1801 domain-containing protein [Bacteroidia bacterium]
MAENKTQKTTQSVTEFLNSIESEQRKQDCFVVLQMMETLTGESPRMWGASIVGFGDYHYKYESGREGDFFRIGFSPRKQNLTLYIIAGFDRYEEIMSRLGKYKTGKSCLYISKLTDIDMDVLKELGQASLEYMAEKYPKK